MSEGTLQYRKTRVLIWGKTYPELSTRHRETVCTGACTESGRPIRLYPVPFRYLTGEHQYHLYDWIEVPIARTPRDTRPESHKLRADDIRIVGQASREKGWRQRREVIFRDRSWHFDCLDQLKLRQQATRQSIGIVPVGQVLEVALVDRTQHEEAEHRDKLKQLSATGDLFGVRQRDLAFVPFRVRIRWRCASEQCQGHSASIMDWGLLELGRRDGREKARARVEELANAHRYDLHLYMGNLFTRQKIFSCIGLWYPLRHEAAAASAHLDLGL